MITWLNRTYDSFIEKFKLQAFREVIIFIFLITFFHFAYRLWANVFLYSVFGFHFMDSVFNFLTDQLRETSTWICNHVLGIHTTISGDLMVHNSRDRMGVTAGCSGLKQYFQFLVLMILYPGPWKKKLWFIPLGLFIIYVINVTRIVTLFLVVIRNIDLFNAVHDWILRPLFFIIIFLLWVWWVEKLAPASIKTGQN